MEWLSALLLGIIQGLTEFLPVSSSGHLELAKVFLGDTVPQEGLLLTIVLHTATALSTVYVFRKDIGAILKGLLEFKKNESWTFALFIVISMIPAAGVGLFLEDQIAQLFEGNLVLVGTAASHCRSKRFGRASSFFQKCSPNRHGAGHCYSTGYF
jgi:undecaprenyl-diphosphatase